VTVAGTTLDRAAATRSSHPLTGPWTTRPPGGAAIPTDVPAFGAGVVRTVELGPFRLESGVELAELVVAYRHDGPPPSEAPQVVVVHALTGSADAAGDWWAPLIGPDRALGTTRYGVLCANLLGGRYGTTGPTSLSPDTGEPYGEHFPALTTRDQARAQWRLLDALGVEEVALVTGGSLGGMVALEAALERPSAVRTVMPMAAPAATGALAIAWNHLQVQLIDRLGDEGLALARQLAMTTYRSEADFELRFGRDIETDGRPSVVSYLDHQGRKLAGRFDADTYASSPAPWTATTSAGVVVAPAGWRRSPRQDPARRCRHQRRHPLRTSGCAGSSRRRPPPGATEYRGSGRPGPRRVPGRVGSARRALTAALAGR
jgi:homoserine O-acetyltransferase